MDNVRYIETIAFMGWNIELTREGFFHFLDNNKEIRLINKPKKAEAFAQSEKMGHAISQ